MKDEECCSVSLNPVKSAIQSAKTLIKNKGRKVSEDLAEERLNICRSCEEYIPRTSQCSVCKCFMHIKTKFEGMECPLNLW